MANDKAFFRYSSVRYGRSVNAVGAYADVVDMKLSHALEQLCVSFRRDLVTLLGSPDIGVVVEIRERSPEGDEFRPLEKPTPGGCDMEVGPCSCGAWHDGSQR